MRLPSPRAAAWILTLLIATPIAADLLWMPVQVYDSVGEILDAQQSPSISASVTGSIGAAAYLRPMRIAQIKALFDLAGGEHYWLVYRGFHALLLIATLLLFTAALRVSTAVDVAALAFALVVLVGLRPFRGVVQEGFPINHFLEVVAFCLLTLNLARSRGGWWADVLAAIVFVLAALTLESGLLVFVVAVTTWVVGWRGISGRGVAAMTVLAAAYLYVRFAVLSTGMPDLMERSSGFLFAMLEPEQLQEQFGAQPLWFYIYNVAASALSVLFSEPTGGVFMFTGGWLSGDLPPRLVLPVVTSVATTGVLAWAALRAWRAGTFDDTARLLVVAAVVVAANSFLSYAYTKDDIMSIAGAFYALAAFSGMRALLLRVEPLPGAMALAVVVLAAALSAGWAVRAAGVHYVLRTYAFRAQNDWVQLPIEWRREGRWPEDPAARQLLRRLHADAVSVEFPNTRVGVPQWPDRIWEE
jgi:hypothetical protein